MNITYNNLTEFTILIPLIMITVTDVRVFLLAVLGHIMHNITCESEQVFCDTSPALF